MIRDIVRFFEDFLVPPREDQPSSEWHDVQFATAVLMMEVCRADQDQKMVEREAIMKILDELFDFSDQELEQLVELAEDTSREAFDLYSFTRLVNAHYDYAAKKQLIKNLWQVAFADGRIDAFEEHIIRRISGLIHLANQDFIHARALARPS